MSALIQTLIDGLLIGGVYGVIAVGLSLVFGVLKIVNFAQAEFLMIGMYAAWFAWSYLGLDPIFGAFIALGVGFLLGALCQRLFVQYILDASPVAQIFLTVGLLAVLENGALLIFGSDFRSVRTVYQTMAFEIGPIFLSVPYVVAFISALVISLLLGW